MNKPILVTCAIIKNNERYLITQRPEGGHLALKWEFPGGKIEPGENPKQALEREIKEKLGIEVKARRLLDTHSNSYDDIDIVLEAWVRDHISGEIQNIGIKNHAWKTPEEMKQCDMAEADMPFIEKLK